MIKSELIATLSGQQNGLMQRDVEEAVNCLLQQMTQALVTGQHIEVRGFGSFTLIHQAPRTGRNPKTGEAVEITEKYKIRFKPGKELKERVNCISN